jgi:hypothetical protein
MIDLAGLLTPKLEFQQLFSSRDILRHVATIQHRDLRLFAIAMSSLFPISAAS